MFVYSKKFKEGIRSCETVQPSARICDVSYLCRLSHELRGKIKQNKTNHLKRRSQAAET